MMINSSGVKVVAILAIATVILGIVSDFLGVVFLIVTLLSLYVFRDSKRYVFENSAAVLSPVDGKIIAIDTVDKKRKIYVKVSLFDQHTIKAPFDAQMKVKRYQKGYNLSPNSPKAKELNEQISYKFISDEKTRYLKLKLIGGFFNTEIKKSESKGVLQGEDISFFIDGVAIITLDNKIETDLQIGEKLIAGQSVLYKS